MEKNTQYLIVLLLSLIKPKKKQQPKTADSTTVPVHGVTVCRVISRPTLIRCSRDPAQRCPEVNIASINHRKIPKPQTQKLCKTNKSETIKTNIANQKKEERDIFLKNIPHFENRVANQIYDMRSNRMF